jgi:transcription elongation factor GreB
MSKAFLRESDFADFTEIPPPVSALPSGAKNYMTARGVERLQSQLAGLVAERPAMFTESVGDPEAKRALQTLDQRIRYLRESLRTAEIVPAPDHPDDRVRFGATVAVRESKGEVSHYRIVGVDEADPDRGLINWTSPIARALLNARQGEKVTFATPVGPKVLEIIEVAYEGAL